MDLDELAEIIQAKLSDFEFVKECEVSHYTTHAKERDFYFYYIGLRGFDDKKSSLGFTYNPNEKRIDHVRADLKKDLAVYDKFFLDELEILARAIGCNEMSSMDSLFGTKWGWFKYPNGTYRKNLRPQDN